MRSLDDGGIYRTGVCYAWSVDFLNSGTGPGFDHALLKLLFTLFTFGIVSRISQMRLQSDGLTGGPETVREQSSL